MPTDRINYYGNEIITPTVEYTSRYIHYSTHNDPLFRNEYQKEAFDQYQLQAVEGDMFERLYNFFIHNVTKKCFLGSEIIPTSSSTRQLIDRHPLDSSLDLLQSQQSGSFMICRHHLSSMKQQKAYFGPVPFIFLRASRHISCLTIV